MLAATIALSPVITTGVVGNPVKVEAATATKEQQLISELNKMYDLLYSKDREQAQLLKTVGKSIAEENIIDDSQIRVILKKGENAPISEDEKYVTERLISLLASSTIGELEEKISDFKKDEQKHVDTFFGNKLTAEQLASFVVEVQSKVLNELKGKAKTTGLADLTGSDFYDIFFEKLLSSAGTLEEGQLKVLYDKFEWSKVKGELIKVSKNIEDYEKARSAFKYAIQLYVDSNQDGTGGNTGGPTTPPATQLPSEIELPAGSVVVENGTTKIPANKVQDIVNAVTADKAVIPVKLDGTTNAEVPASLFSEVVKKNAKAVVEVKTDAASYKLPASQINVADLAKQLGVAAADVKISVSVKVVDVKTSEKLASKVVEFKIEAVAGDKKQAVSTFSVYVERAITGDQNFNAKNQVAVVLDDNGKVLKSVPTVFDGKTATVKSLTNSKYAIVENNVTFPDVTNKEWAKSYIETLASKYIVKGHDTGKFAPNGTTTRAEFAVLLVRALGLPGEKYDNRFSDVKGTEWFNENGELAAAVKHGIIEGYDTGKFNPNGKVSRAEAAAMIARAIELDFLNFDKSKFDSSKQLTKFKDANKVPAWAKEELTAVLQAGIMSGHENNTIDANGSTTRNQIAKIVAELLIKSNLMNDTINK